MTATFGSGTRESREGAETISELQKLIRSKLEISWSDYCKQRAIYYEATDRLLISDESCSEPEDSGGESYWATNAGI